MKNTKLVELVSEWRKSYRAYRRAEKALSIKEASVQNDPRSYFEKEEKILYSARREFTSISRKLANMK